MVLQAATSIGGNMRRIQRLTVLALLFLIACGKKHPGYFRHVIVDGANKFSGQIPLSATSSERLSCFRLSYDDRMNVVKVEHLVNGRLNRGIWGSEVAQIVIEVDNGGRTVRLFDAKGSPTSSGKDAVCSFQQKLDGKGSIISEFNYDCTGRLAKDRSGVAQYLFVVDARGRQIQTDFSDERGNVIANIDGAFSTRYSYAGDDVQWSERSFHGRDGNLIEDANGSSFIQRSFDPATGAVVEERLYGLKHQLKEGREGFAVKRRRFDELGNLTEIQMLSIDERLKSRVAKIFDENGNSVEERHYGSGSDLEENSDGVAVYRSRYDANGNTIELLKFGADGMIRLDKNGAAGWQSEYDLEGRKTELRTVDGGGRVISAEGICAIVKMEYDSRGKLTKKACLNRNRQVVRLH